MATTKTKSFSPARRRRLITGALWPLLLLALCLVVCPGCKRTTEISRLYDLYEVGSWYRQTCPLVVRDIPYLENAAKDQFLDIYPIKSDKLAPVIIFVHGGGWKIGNTIQHAGLAKSFNDRGYVTVLPEYRKHPSVKYPAFVDDTVNALNWAMANIENYGGDPHRVVVAGHSAGAHLVALVFTSDEFRKKLTFEPMLIQGLATCSGPYDFDAFPRKSSRKFFRKILGGDIYRSAMPITHVRHDVPPWLVLVGEKDLLTPVDQSDLYSKAMAEAGANVYYDIIKEGNHISVLLDMVPGLEGPALKSLMAFADEMTYQTLLY